jgi:hypothetical protein
MGFFFSAPERRKSETALGARRQPNKFQPLNFNCDWIWQFTLAGRLLLARIGIVLAHTRRPATLHIFLLQRAVMSS